MFVEGGGREPRRDVMSLEAFIGWLETKRPNGQYHYLNNEKCLICQYLIESGMATLDNIYVDGAVYQIGGRVAKLPDGWNIIAKGDHSRAHDQHTYGQALSRALLFQNANSRAKKVKALLELKELSEPEQNTVAPKKRLLDRLLAFC